MKERGILFSAPMVRALLNGSKTQTRRAVKPDLRDGLDFMGGGPDVDPDEGAGVDLRWGEMQFDDSGDSGKPQWLACCADYPEEGFIEIGTGYGNVGDRLWVREAWRTVAEADALPPRDLTPAHRLWFEATSDQQPGFGRLRPGMFMPRWASRITLEVTGVRVERLNDISEADAKAEGCDALHWPHEADKDRELIDWPLGEAQNPYRNGYALLWEQINGYGSWAANPWVWCVEFKRLP